MQKTMLTVLIQTKILTEEESRKILLLLDNVIYKIEKQIENYIKSEVKNVEYKD